MATVAAPTSIPHDSPSFFMDSTSIIGIFTSSATSDTFLMIIGSASSATITSVAIPFLTLLLFALFLLLFYLPVVLFHKTFLYPPKQQVNRSTFDIVSSIKLDVNYFPKNFPLIPRSVYQSYGC